MFQWLILTATHGPGVVHVKPEEIQAVVDDERDGTILILKGSYDMYVRESAQEVKAQIEKAIKENTNG